MNDVSNHHITETRQRSTNQIDQPDTKNKFTKQKLKHFHYAIKQMSSQSSIRGKNTTIEVEVKHFIQMMRKQQAPNLLAYTQYMDSTRQRNPAGVEFQSRQSSSPGNVSVGAEFQLGQSSSRGKVPVEEEFQSGQRMDTPNQKPYMHQLAWSETKNARRQLGALGYLIGSYSPLVN